MREGDVRLLLELYDRVLTGDRVFAQCRSDAYRAHVVGCAKSRDMAAAAQRARRELDVRRECEDIASSGDLARNPHRDEEEEET